MVAAAPYLKDPDVFLANTVWVLVLFASSWLLRPACRMSLRNRRPWFLHEMHALFFALVLSFIAVVLVDLVIIRGQANDWSGLPLDFVQNAVVLFLWCNIYFGGTQWQEMSQQRERMLRAETELREAKLNALRYQLNPHFLFNALNAVSTLVLERDSERATRMLSRIGTLLRRTLEEESTAEIPLAQELEFINQYLEVEQIRLGERLHGNRPLCGPVLDEPKAMSRMIPLTSLGIVVITLVIAQLQRQVGSQRIHSINEGHCGPGQSQCN